MKPFLLPLAVFAVASLPVLAADSPTPAPVREIAPGPFKPTWDSLEAGYKCPEWFRDAKFGIWAHWTAQCVPEQGDWYARNMYIQGSHDYQYQVEHYGHPSKVGFKDIDHIWHAEHWDPDKLMDLYVKAGAHYFVALANHHDNLDMWDSKYQPWNSVAVGPHKDIVAGWKAAATKQNLPFGVTVHCARTWSWFEVAHGSDKTGTLAGVPYDGNLTKADGKGQWWDGLDPADLYAPAHKPGEKPDAAYVTKFFNRVKDLLDSYHPDLLYFDDRALPLGEAGLNIAAHDYNANLAWNGGKLSAIINGKGLSPDERKGMVEDYERGSSNDIKPDPWQTDTCIGSWHYDVRVFQRHGYKTAKTVEQLLCNTVSKNGNLLLNIPLKGDGTIDSDELKVLQDLAAWMPVHGEGIFGSRPWKVFGENSPAVAAVKSSGFNEGKLKYTAQDIRFTTQGDHKLYVWMMDWPADGKETIKTLADGGQLTGKIARVTLLGGGKVDWTRDASGLHVQLPATQPTDGVSGLKVELE